MNENIFEDLNGLTPQIVVITGTSTGIGKATAILFLSKGYFVIGIDKDNSNIDNNIYNHENYLHLKYDIVKDFDDIPWDRIAKVCSVLINNAGVQTNTVEDIDVNLTAIVKITEEILKAKNVHSIVNVASISAHTGEEYPYYTASKGGLLSYTKNVAQRCAEWNCTCNSISPGGVITEMNHDVINDANKWDQIMKVTPLKRWAEPEEIANWIYFLTEGQHSMTGQDVIIDNGENIYSKFVS